MLERIRHPELCEFLDEIENTIDQVGPKGTDAFDMAAEKRARLDELLSCIVNRNRLPARLDRSHRCEQAVRWAGRRSYLLREHVERALMPPRQVPAAPAPVATIPGGRDGAASRDLLRAAASEAADMETLDGAPQACRAHVVEKPSHAGFAVDVSIPDFGARYVQGRAHKSFRALGRKWRLELVRDRSNSRNPGFWLTLVEGNPFTAGFAFTVLGADDVSASKHSNDKQCTWIADTEASGWGYSWEKFNAQVFVESTGTSGWVDRTGTLHVRAELLRI